VLRKSWRGTVGFGRKLPLADLAHFGLECSQGKFEVTSEVIAWAASCQDSGNDQCVVKKNE
jgi:hypothetical protein